MSIVEIEERTATRLLEQDDPTRASRFLGLAPVEGESSGDRWNDSATARIASGHPLRAEWGYCQALCVDPSHRQAAVNLAAVLMACPRAAEAWPVLEPHSSSLTGKKRRPPLRA